MEKSRNKQIVGIVVRMTYIGDGFVEEVFDCVVV